MREKSLNLLLNKKESKKYLSFFLSLSLSIGNLEATFSFVDMKNPPIVQTSSSSIRTIVSRLIFLLLVALQCQKVTGFFLSNKKNESPTSSSTTTTTRILRKKTPTTTTPPLPSEINAASPSSSSSSTTTTTTTEGDNTSSEQQEEQQQYSITPLLDWNVSASGSIGSLLMQMQRKEEEMRKFNKTLMDEEQFLVLSPDDDDDNNDDGDDDDYEAGIIGDKKRNKKKNRRQKKEKELSTIPRMNYETAKELDEAVRIRLSSSVGSDAVLLDLPPLYRVLLDDGDDGETTKTTTTTMEEGPKTKEQQQEQEEGEEEDLSLLPALSSPSHYEERIGRDMRRLAVSIASCIDDVSDWRELCLAFQPTGGLFPLIECIREGASTIRKRRDDDEISDLVESRYEESFLAATSACRALRDLCALNLDLAAVITDGLLRANNNDNNSNHNNNNNNIGVSSSSSSSSSSTSKTNDGQEEELHSPLPSSSSSLLNDLVTLLNYAHDNTEIVKPISRRRRVMDTLRRKKKKQRQKSPRRSRKGMCVSLFHDFVVVTVGEKKYLIFAFVSPFFKNLLRGSTTMQVICDTVTFGHDLCK